MTTLLNLRRLLPLRVYATLESYVAEADLADFITLSGDVFKIGVLILWNGQEYRNPCKAGLAMTQSMRLHFGIPDTRSMTFDGWHRLKVVLRCGTVMRLDELLTPDIRRNAVPFVDVPEVIDTVGQRALLDMLAGPEQNILRNNTVAVNAAAPASAVSPLFLALQPYLTILSEFCNTANVPDIVRAVKMLPENTLFELLDVNAHKLLTVLRQDLDKIY